MLLTELGLASAIAVAFNHDDLGVVGQAVDQGDHAGGIGKDVSQCVNGRFNAQSIVMRS